MVDDVNADKEALIELQSKLAFQEHTLEDLNQVITHQQQQIDRLAQQVLLLKDKCEALEYAQSQPQGGTEQEKPPHY